jgi:lipid A 3-O-deacylase
MIRTHFLTLALVLTVLGVPLAKAGPPTPKDGKVQIEPARSPFDKGHKEFQVLTGTYFSFAPGPSARPTVNSTMTSLRLGVMLDDVRGTGWLRGNYEFLLEAFGGAIYQGPGNALGGATLQLRYNFVQPDTRWLPYFQIGAGGVYSDMYKDHTRAVVGSAVNFNLQSAVGIRCLLKENWAFTIEGGYRHISNAGFSNRNAGMNSLGAQIGLSYFF